MENRAHALAAGLFVLLFGIAIALTVWWFRQDKDEVSYYLLETRKSVGGLNKEALVRYRGIRAGKVESIYLDPVDSRLILVKISLDDDYKLTKATTAALTSQGITGLTYIALDDDGSNTEPLTAPEGQLPRIKLKPTLLDSIADSAADAVQQIRLVATRLNAILSEKNTENLSHAIDNIAVASDGLRDVPAIMASLRSALSPENMKRLNQALANIEQTAGETAPLAREARELVGNLNHLSERVDVMLGSSGGEAAQVTLPRANALMKELTDTSRQLSRLLETLDDSPQSLLFGKPQAKPGPGESGFGGGK
jgi:phospholipid/cholesterol/gamma-HCH transport system substrate-binding protein